MDRNKTTQVAKFIASTVLSVLVIAYIIYHIVNSFGSSIETTPALLVDVNETITVDAYIFRDETVLSSDTSGGVNCLYADGTMVRKNVPVADIYASSSSKDVQTRIAEIDDQISILKSASSSESTSFVSSTTISNELDTLYYNVQTKTNQNDISYAFRRKNEFLTLLNKRLLAQQVVVSFADRIEQLQAERDSLTASLSTVLDTVNSPESGYFSSEIDGYEEYYTPDVLDTLTIDAFDELTLKEPKTYTANVVGKLATDYKWYIACKVNTSDASVFLASEDYNVIFPYSSDQEITMNLYRTVVDEESGTTLLIFSTGEIPDGFSFLRSQSAEIIVQSYRGYKVPVSAVRIVDGQQGVYVLEGNLVSFKQIDSLVEIDGSLIVSEQDKTNDEDYADKLGYYDQIITKGNNLYANKIVG